MKFMVLYWVLYRKTKSGETGRYNVDYIYYYDMY